MNSHVRVEKAALGRQDEISAAVERLFAQSFSAARLGPGVRVLIKPNLLSRSAPEKAVTTHPDVLRAVFFALQKRGVHMEEVTVADSPGGPSSPVSLKALYEGCGIAAVCAEFGAHCYMGGEEKRFTRATSGRMVKEFELLAPVRDADFIINLPKMKTHVLCVMSGAVKNLFGFVPGLYKAEFHMRFPQRPHFAGMIVDLCEAVHADLHIVDGLLAMEGDGPGSGTPRRCDLLLAGEDPYLVDLALCHLMGMDPMGTPVLAEAHARGLCPAALPKGAFIGEAAAMRPIPNYAPPRSYSGRVDFSGNVPGFLRPVVSALAEWAAPRPVIRSKKCIGCGKCAAICPQKVVTLEGDKAHIERKGCIKCFCCHEVCPVRAVDVRRSRLFRM